MRKILPILLSVVIMSCELSACAPVRPIRELRIVETLGCDLSEGGVSLSIAAAEPRLRLTQEAPSLRLAMDRLRDQAASEALFFAHTRFLLIGQAIGQGNQRIVDMVIIIVGHLFAVGIVLNEVFQLHIQYRSLNLVQATVATYIFENIFFL